MNEVNVRVGRLLAVAFVVGAATSAWADTLTLTNGSTVEGTITAESPTEVSIHSEGASWTYKREKIAKVEKGGSTGRAATSFGQTTPSSGPSEIVIYDGFKTLPKRSSNAIHFGTQQVNPGDITMYVHELAEEEGLDDNHVNDALLKRARMRAAEDLLILDAAGSDRVLRIKEIRTWLLDQYRRAEHISAEDYGRVGDYQRKSYFKDHQAEFKLPDSVKVMAATLPAGTSEDEVRATRKLPVSSKEWKEAGWTGGGATIAKYSASVNETLSHLAVGEVSAPITDDQGRIVIFRATAVRSGNKMSYNEAHTLVALRMIREHHTELFDEHPNAGVSGSEDEKAIVGQLIQNGFLKEMHVARHLGEWWMRKMNTGHDQAVVVARTRLEKSRSWYWSYDY